jgi:hypothetical protein
MVESESDIFPIPKLRNYTYITLDVLTYIEFEKVCKFMFAVNKTARTFLSDNFIAARNTFTNEGLFIHNFDLFEYFDEEINDVLPIY